MTQTPLPANCVEADGMTIHLKNRTLAAVLAFVFPGAGHWYQGRTGKAGLFCGCIMLLFVTGLFLSGGKCVYASWSGADYRWHYVLQAGIGLPALPAAIQWYNERSNQRHASFLGSWMRRPQSIDELSNWHLKTSAGFDLGTLYTMVAGLLNILVIFDAYSGPLPLPGHDSRKKKTSPDAPA